MQRRRFKTTESDFGSGTAALLPKNVPSVHMFHKVHFFIALSEICPQQPQPFFISGRRRRALSTPPPLRGSFFNCSVFFRFDRGPRFLPSSGPGCSFCFCLAPVCRFWSLVKPPVCFVISSSHPRPRPNVCAVSIQHEGSCFVFATLWKPLYRQFWSSERGRFGVTAACGDCLARENLSNPV